MNRYDEAISVELVRASDKPLELVTLAADITMKQNFGVNLEKEKLPGFLLSANHTSLLEHVTYTFLIKGATRSFLAQVTRHRMSSFTSGSQHYQYYGNYGFISNIPEELNKRVQEVVKGDILLYNVLIENGVPREEARQILPSGMQNNLLWTINARSLVNF